MSDTSTKRAEEIAYNLHLSGVSGSTWRATEGNASNMLRALAAERDARRAALQTARRDALEEAARWHHEQGRFWMEKGREVSALDSQSGLNLLAKAAEHRKHAAAIRALKGEGDE